MTTSEARTQLAQAMEASRRAEARAQQFAEQAEEAGEAAQKAAREAAATAALIQKAEAGIEAARAQYALAQNARSALAARLAQRREPLVRLTAALQTSARRPLALSALQPGSLKELVYVRAVLNSAVPEIRERTSALRSDLAEGRRLEQMAASALAAEREADRNLRARRAELAEFASRQRLASRDARAIARRESARALAFAEEARDFDGLLDRLTATAALRAELSALDGPKMRPGNLGNGSDAPSASETLNASATDDDEGGETNAAAARPPVDFRLPALGSTLAGFGEQRAGGLRSRGITLLPSPGAQIVAPASGRVAFSGPYEGFGRVVIIEHPGGWTSVVTGMERADVEIGDTIIAGAPLGIARERDRALTVELRREGEPVNPADFL